MAGQLLRIPIKLRPIHLPFYQHVANITGKAAIGSREIVGYGHNGAYIYFDCIATPFSAIRFKEIKPDMQGVKEKEVGDWKKLSIQDKKSLYRTSYCQTYEEMLAPSGEWKGITGYAFMIISLAIWSFICVKVFLNPPLPDSLSLESRRAQLRRIIDIRAEPITGIASKWDYENNRWKK